MTELDDTKVADSSDVFHLRNVSECIREGMTNAEIGLEVTKKSLLRTIVLLEKGQQSRALVVLRETIKSVFERME